MRTTTITLGGEERLLCFSTRVVLVVTNKYGSLEAMFDALRDPDQNAAMSTALWVLEQMMDAGSRYAQHEGLDAAPPLTVDEILDLSDPLEMLAISARVQEAMEVGTSREVEAKPPKKAKAGADKPQGKPGRSGGPGTASTSA